MLRRLLLMSLAGLIALASPAAAQPVLAQRVCADHDDLLARLSKVYDELPTALGVTETGNLVEVVSAANGSWTIVVTVPEGRSCIVAVGDAWQTIPVQNTDPLS